MTLRNNSTTSSNYTDTQNPYVDGLHTIGMKLCSKERHEEKELHRNKNSVLKNRLMKIMHENNIKRKDKEEDKREEEE